MELVLVKDKINKILAVAVLAGIIICNICSVWCTVCWCVATRNLVALHVCMAAQQQNSSHMSLFSPKGCNLKLCMSTSCPTIPPSESFTPKIPHFVSPCHWTSFPNQKPPHTHTHWHHTHQPPWEESENLPKNHQSWHPSTPDLFIEPDLFVWIWTLKNTRDEPRYPGSWACRFPWLNTAEMEILQMLRKLGGKNIICQKVISLCTSCVNLADCLEDGVSSSM